MFLCDIVANPNINGNQALPYLIEVDLSPEKSTNFRIIKENLERYGIANKASKVLYQVCHILQKKEKHYIVHYNVMHLLDKKPNMVTLENVCHNIIVAKSLEKWGLLKIIDSDSLRIDIDQVKIQKLANVSPLCIVSHGDKDNWEFVKQHTLGHNVQKEYDDFEW